MKKQFDYLVFIGRFQPFHIGHKQIIEKALEMAEKVFVLIGSSDQPRTIKNPFTFFERKKVIDACFLYANINIQPIRDSKYNDQAWAKSVQNAVNIAIASTLGWTDKPIRGGIIGHSKDQSSYYLSMFPQWDLVDVPLNEQVNATDIRDQYFSAPSIRYIQGVLPDAVYLFMDQFKTTDEYRSLYREYEFIQKYKRSWEAAPYAPTFVTVDAVVVQAGHILLIKRKAEPGKGLWALPGGFVNQKERLEDAMIRELREETRLKVPVPVLRGNIKSKEVFDHPDRSLRGRTITQAYFIELPSGKLPAVKGTDDAEVAKWVPLANVREQELFEDHFAIIQQFVGNI